MLRILSFHLHFFFVLEKTANYQRMQRIVASLSEEEKYNFHQMEIYFSNIWSKGNNVLKTQAQKFLQGCDKSLLEMFKKIRPNFTCDETLIDIYRKHSLIFNFIKTCKRSLYTFFNLSLYLLSRAN